MQRLHMSNVRSSGTAYGPFTGVLSFIHYFHTRAFHQRTSLTADPVVSVQTLIYIIFPWNYAVYVTILTERCSTWNYLRFNQASRCTQSYSPVSTSLVSWGLFKRSDRAQCSILGHPRRDGTKNNYQMDVIFYCRSSGFFLWRSGRRNFFQADLRLYIMGAGTASFLQSTTHFSSWAWFSDALRL